MTSHKERLNKGYFPFLVPGLVLLLLVIGLPFLMSLWTSFTKWNGVGPQRFIGFDNYVKAFGDTTFWASFTNNLLMIFAVTVVPTILGLALAVFLFDYFSRRFPAGVTAAIKAGIYLPQILPVAIAGIVWGWILDPSFGAFNGFLNAVGLGAWSHDWLGSADTALGSVMAIMVWFQIGYPLVIFLAALQRVDPQVMEAAALDGANWRVRFQIVSYLIRPEILVVVLTTTVYALKLFGPIYVLTRGGPGHATIVPSYFAYQNFFEKANVGYGSAIATLMTLIIVGLTIVFLRVQARQEKIEEV
jgi:raffinose/stachyose/melibiose transport system permease protein